MRILQGIARGVLGTASFEGGAATAVLGGVLHYVIAMSMVVTYYAVSQNHEDLTRRPLACGLAYGVLLYLIMNLVVVPLSAIGMQKFNNTLWVVLSVVMHALFGVICAVAAQHANAARGARGRPS